MHTIAYLGTFSHTDESTDKNTGAYAGVRRDNGSGMNLRLTCFRGMEQGGNACKRQFGPLDSDIGYTGCGLSFLRNENAGSTDDVRQFAAIEERDLSRAGTLCIRRRRYFNVSVTDQFTVDESRYFARSH
jgi:hypothetical protein